MANVTRRYFFRGPWASRLKLATDPNLTLALPRFGLAFDVTFNDAVVTVADMDDQMQRSGCIPDTFNTIAIAPNPFIGLASPDGSIWRITVNNAGVISTDKVS